MPLAPADAFESRLSALVSPSDWINPVPAGRYHLVVVGGGAAGLVAAIGAAGLGARVALVERDRLGGDCLNSGCVPSKSLIASSRLTVSSVLGMNTAPGDRTGEVGPAPREIAFRKALERLHRSRATLAPHDSAERLRSLGIDLYFGNAEFQPDGRSIQVRNVVLPFRKAVLCTGSRPHIPEIAGLQGSEFLTTDQFFSLTSLPRRLIVLGAGASGIELGQAMARLGSQVTIVECGSRMLIGEDSSAAELIQERLQADGIQIECGHRIQHVARREGAVNVATQHQGGQVSLVGDQLLVATGRIPNVSGLALEAAGIHYDAQTGIQVDDFMRTTNPHVYAAGDVCSVICSSSLANAQARLVLRNALFRGRKKQSRLVLPRCLFSTPELAQVGLTEEEARQHGLKIEVLSRGFDTVDRSQLEEDTTGFAKIILKRGTDQILGGTIVSPYAGELIMELTHAMTHRLGLRQLGNTLRPYPTRGDILRQLADEHQRRRLTPRVRRWLQCFMDWC